MCTDEHNPPRHMPVSERNLRWLFPTSFPYIYNHCAAGYEFQNLRGNKRIVEHHIGFVKRSQCRAKRSGSPGPAPTR